MLLLVTIGLVVVGLIALVIGFVSNSLAPIYLSIACSVIAGIVLLVFSRMARRGDSGTSAAPAQASPGSWSPSTASASPPPVPAPAPPEAPSYRPPPAPAPAPRVPTTGPAPARSTPIGRRPVSKSEAEPEMESEPTIVLDEAVSASGADADGFPIAGYDAMRASQIVTMLADLDLDELDMVQEREEQGKNRATVLRRVVERIDQLEAEDVDGASLEDDDEDTDLEPVAVAEDFPAAADDEFPADADDDDGFPIAGYDSLSAEDVIAVLDDLEDDELDLVAEREEMGQNRAAILDYIDDMFEEVDGAPEPSAPSVVTPPAPRAAAKKAPTKKAAAAKRAPAKKVAAKKVAAAPAGRKAAGTVKAAPRKATAAKRPAAASGAVASPGTKSAGRRSAAPAAKAAKAPAKVTTRAAAAKKAAVKKAVSPTRKR